MVLVAALVAVLLAGGFPVAFEAEIWRGPSERVGGAAEPSTCILTLNRWWDSPEAEREVDTIRRANADLVALQEADGFEPEAARLKDLYPYQLFCGAACDTAILSKRPFTAAGAARTIRAGGPARPTSLWAGADQCSTRRPSP